MSKSIVIKSSFILFSVAIVLWVMNQFIVPIELLLKLILLPFEILPSNITVGIGLIIAPILLAFPINYYLNVTRTTAGGVIQVSGVWDYIGHGIASIAARLILIGSIFYGIYLLFFGW